MKFHKIIYLFQLLFLLNSCTSQSPSITGETEERENPDSLSIFTGALTELATGFDFTEGPIADSAGNVYFTDQPNNRIYVWTVQDSLEIFTSKSGRSNGLYFDLSQRLIGCVDSSNALWRFDKNGNVDAVLVKGFLGKRFNGPNDLWVDTQGGIYFTDPFYERDYWENHPGNLKDTQAVYYLPSGADEAIRIANDYQKPNGIVASEKEGILYIADIGADSTFSYRIEGPGKLGPKTFFAARGSDGMTIDAAGNVYLTGDGVFVYNAKGDSIAHLEVPENWTANVCFGGRHFDKLFITASRGLYSVPVKFKGN